MKLPAFAALAAALLGACAEAPPKFLPADEGPSAAGDGGAAGDASATGGASGAGGTADEECEPSSVAADCAPEECYLATCVRGRCEYDPVEPGTSCGADAARFCSGAGDCVDCFEDAQCESAGPCTLGDCSADGTCTQQFLEAGENCDDGEFCNGDEACDGRGACLPGRVRCAEPTVCDEEARQCAGCLSNLDCPDDAPICNDQDRCVCTSDAHCTVADECRVGRCDVANGTCHREDVAAGTEVGDPVAGDCRSRECNGSGAVISADDDVDEPADPGGGCTRPTCRAGEVVPAPRAAGTGCGDAATECSQADTCNGAGACQFNHVPSGAVVRNESIGDCRRRTCNGSGSALETPIHVACNDGLFCTGTESCSGGGVCQATGSPCAAPRPFCVNTECHACNSDAQCPGLRGAGTGRCVGGTCRECTDATVAVDCGGTETGCTGGSCRVTCNCSEEACNRRYSQLCARL